MVFSQSSDSKNGNVVQEKEVVLRIHVFLKTRDLPSWSGKIDYHFFTFTTGDVKGEVFDSITVYSNGPYSKIELTNALMPLGSATIPLGTSFHTEQHQQDECARQATDYVNQHIDDFKSKIIQKIPKAAQATKIEVDAVYE